MVRRFPIRLLMILACLSGGSALLPPRYLPIGILVVPLIGVIGGMLLPPRMRGKTWGLGVSASTLFAAFAMAMHYDWHQGGYQFVVKGPRIESLGFQFGLGLDQISLLLVLLTAVLHPIAVTASLRSVHMRSREHYANMNLLLVFMLGTFMATDLLLFYVFFEASLVPLFFIVGIWGGKERRRAAVTLFLYTFSASVFALASIVYLGLRAQTFDIPSVVFYAQAHMTSTERFWVLLGLLAAFCVKTPLFPLHTWLPLAHTEAPTAGSVDLAALVLKLGTYGLLRIALPVGLINADGSVLFPQVLNVVSHLGFCVLGMLALNPEGMAGSVLYMINHGIVSGALFLTVGMIYNRYHTRDIRELSGLARAMPKLAFFMMLFTMAALGLPGLNGFVSEFLTILGAFTSEHLGVAYGVIASLGIILGAAYMLRFGTTLLFGPLHYPLVHEEHGTHRTVHPQYVPGGDITNREVLVLLPLAILVIVLGVFPTPLLKSLEQPLNAIRHAGAAGAVDRPMPPAMPVATVAEVGPAGAK
jgi:NADH-quinone oxidoreductase subunit M